MRRRQQLQPGHQERAVAGQRHDAPVRAGQRGAQSRRDGVAHAGVVHRREERAGPVESEDLHRQEGPIPAVGREDCLGPVDLLDGRQQVARGDSPRPARLDLLRPDRRVAVGDRGPQLDVEFSAGEAVEQRRHEAPGVRHHPDLRRVVRPDRGFVHVHMQQRARRLQPVAARAHLGEAAADRQREVAGASELADEGRRGTPEARPEPEGVALGEDALPLDGRGHRGLEPLRQGHQVRAGAGGAQPEIQQRPLRLRQQRPDSVELTRPRTRRRFGRWRPGRECKLVAEEVVVRRDLDEHGAGGGGAGDLAGPAQGGVDLRAVGRTQLCLGDGTDHRRLIDIVKLIRLPGVGADPAAEDEEGDQVHIGLGDP